MRIIEGACLERRHSRAEIRVVATEGKVAVPNRETIAIEAVELFHEMVIVGRPFLAHMADAGVVGGLKNPRELLVGLDVQGSKSLVAAADPTEDCTHSSHEHHAHRHATVGTNTKETHRPSRGR